MLEIEFLIIISTYDKIFKGILKMLYYYFNDCYKITLY